MFRVLPWVLSFFILAIFGALVLFRWTEFSTLSLNEVGDLLAGLSASLALVWLVAGFFVQSRELRNSVNALQKQTAEWKDSVKAQNSLSLNAEKQLTHDREIRNRELWLDARKAELDCRGDIDEIGALLDKLEKSRPRVLAAQGTRLGGARQIFSEKLENFKRQGDDIFLHIEKNSHILRNPSDHNDAPTNAIFFDLRIQSRTLLERVREEIRKDEESVREIWMENQFRNIASVLREKSER